MAPNFRLESYLFLAPHFKRYIIKYVVPSIYTELGLVFNIRNRTNNSEIILKDIHFHIETSNPKFSIMINITSYVGKTDYLKYIDYVAGTNVHQEYNGLQTVTLSTKKVLENGAVSIYASTTTPASSTLNKKIVYLIGPLNPARKRLADIGTVSDGGNFTLKNVHFLMPQFDDSIKRPSNQLDELYTNLRMKLK